MALEAGSIVVNIDGNTTDLESALKKMNDALNNVKTGSKKTGDGFKGMAASFLTANLGAAAIQKGLSFLKTEITDSIKKAIDLQETSNKFKVTFKDVATEAQKTANVLRSAYGLSKQEALGLLSATGDLLTGFGFTGQKALELSGSVQKLAVDLASFQNLAGGSKQASDALTKALLGETESAKSLGIVIRAADVDARMVAAGKDKLTGMSKLQAEAEIRLKIAMEQSKNAIGDYARTADGLANTQRTLAGRVDDIKAKFGEAFLPVMEMFTASMKRSAEGTSDFLENANNFSVLTKVIGGLGFVLNLATKSISGIFLAFKQFVQIGIVAGQAVWELVKPIMNLKDSFFNLTANIKDGVIFVFNELVGVVDTIKEKFGQMKDFLIDLLPESFKEKIIAAKDALVDLGQNAGTGFDEVSAKIKKGLVNVIENMPASVKTSYDLIKKNLEAMGGDWSKLGIDLKEDFIKVFLQGNEEIIDGLNTQKTKLLEVGATGTNVYGKMAQEAQTQSDSAVGSTGKISSEWDSFSEKTQKGFDIASGALQKIELVLSSVQGALNGLGGAIQGYFDMQKENIDINLENEVNSIDQKMEKELEARGLLEEDDLTKREMRIAELQRELDTTQNAEDKKKIMDQISEERKAIEKGKIEKKYQDEKTKLERKAAKDKYKIDVQAFNVKKNFDIANAVISMALGIVQAWTAAMGIGNPIAAIVFGAVLTGIVAAAGAVNIATIAGRQPPPAPAFATGGVMPGTSLTGDNLRAGINSGEVILANRDFGRLMDILDNGVNNSPTVINMSLDGEIIQRFLVRNLRREAYNV